MIRSTFQKLEAKLTRKSTEALRELSKPAKPAKTPTQRISRMYAGAQGRRNANTLPKHTSSADAELKSSLTNLRGRARALGRDSSYGKRAKLIVVNNVVGAGIGLQGQVMSARGKPIKRINTAIETTWRRWCRGDSCHTGGTLHFGDFERLVMAEVFEAGECFVRMHMRPFGSSKIPFALELIEAERVPEHVQPDRGFMGPGVRMGIEVDSFYRPLAYWVREVHPGDTVFAPVDPAMSRVTRVPAEEMIHLRLVDRWPQSRGVPWMHTAILKLNDMEGYSEAEIIAARAAASYVGAIERADWQDPNLDLQDDGELVEDLEPGTFMRLDFGEKASFFAPNRPNSSLDPFMRYMLREVAAGCGVSYESLSRDYSQSNYSSSRLALLDDRDLWRVLQQWFIRSFRDTVHRTWLQQAVLANQVPGVSVAEYALNPDKFESAKYKPRGWTWIDPQKEVNAAKEAIRAGLTTRTQVIASTAEGRDIEDVDEERRQELDSAAQMGLEFDTDPGADAPETRNRPASADGEGDDDTDEDADDGQAQRTLRAIR